MKPKITIIDGNNEIELSAIEDNVKAFMVKGEPGSDGVSPTATVTKTGDTATISITDKNGTTEADVIDGFDPTVVAARNGNKTTLTITDIDGTRTTDIFDGVDNTGGVPTDGVIGWDNDDIFYACDGTESGDYYFTYDSVNYYFSILEVEEGDLLFFNTTTLKLTFNGTEITTASTGTGTELTFIEYIPNGYELTDETFGGGGGIVALKTIIAAPSTFAKGDKYYNSTDDLIYTATSSSAWNSGETPSATSLYLNEADNKLYRYYNNTMNLEGGAGETLPVGTEVDFDGQASDIPIGWEEVTNPDSYSTSEVKTNKVWIDGKPIYRKVISIASMPNTTTGIYPHGISNLKNIVNCFGFYYGDVDLSTFVAVPIAGAYPLTGFIQYGTIIEEINNTNIKIFAGTDRSAYSAYVILEYTKTTD